MLDFIVILSVFLIVLGLMTPVDDSKTSIVLGDKSGQKNAIVIKAKKAELVVDEPLQMVKLKADGKISKPVKISPENLKGMFGDAMDAAPQKAFRTNIFFEEKTEFNREGSKEIFKIIKQIKKRQPCIVDIIGYTDTKGTKKENFITSEKRAGKVKTLLIESGVKIVKINIFAYGEAGQLIPTKDNVSEKRNRRVEVVIR